MQENLTYEKAFTELKKLLSALQEEAVSVDDLSAKMQRAAELIAFCREKLRQTEEEINGLFGDEE